MTDELKARRAPRGARVAFTTADGRTHDRRADSTGLIKPHTAEEELIFAAMDFPEVRSEPKAPSKPKTKTTKTPAVQPAETKPEE